MREFSRPEVIAKATTGAVLIGALATGCSGGEQRADSPPVRTSESSNDSACRFWDEHGDKKKWEVGEAGIILRGGADLPKGGWANRPIVTMERRSDGSGRITDIRLNEANTVDPDGSFLPGKHIAAKSLNLVVSQGVLAGGTGARSLDGCPNNLHKEIPVIQVVTLEGRVNGPDGTSIPTFLKGSVGVTVPHLDQAKAQGAFAYWQPKRPAEASELLQVPEVWAEK